MKPLQLVSIAILLASLCGASAAIAKTYYKWVDDSGVTHYSEQKPFDRPSEEVVIKGGRQSSVEQPSQPPAATRPTTQTSPSTSGDTTASDASGSKDSQLCQDARKNMDTLKNYARVRFEDANGQLRYMEEEEKQQKIVEIQKVIDEAC